MAEKIIILMGSKSDMVFADAIREGLRSFELEAEYHIASAHKSAAYLLKLLADYEMMDCPRVYITVAGRSNALSGMVDANVSSPVISCPPYSDRFAGADLFSSLRMPSGVAPMTILEPAGAALAAAKILAVSDPVLRRRVQAYQEAQTQRIIEDDRELRI